MTKKDGKNPRSDPGIKTNSQRVEVLPYHTLGLFKWQKLGIPYTLDGVRTPMIEVKKAEEILEVSKYQ